MNKLMVILEKLVGCPQDKNNKICMLCRKEATQAHDQIIELFREDKLLKACKRFVKNSPCKNGCDKNDMTCDTNFAKRAITEAEKKIGGE